MLANAEKLPTITSVSALAEVLISGLIRLIIHPGPGRKIIPCGYPHLKMQTRHTAVAQILVAVSVRTG